MQARATLDRFVDRQASERNGRDALGTHDDSEEKAYVEEQARTFTNRESSR